MIRCLSFGHTINKNVREFLVNNNCRDTQSESMETKDLSECLLVGRVLEHSTHREEKRTNGNREREWRGPPLTLFFLQRTSAKRNTHRRRSVCMRRDGGGRKGQKYLSPPHNCMCVCVPAASLSSSLCVAGSLSHFWHVLPIHGIGW